MLVEYRQSELRMSNQVKLALLIMKTECSIVNA